MYQCKPTVSTTANGHSSICHPFCVLFLILGPAGRGHQGPKFTYRAMLMSRPMGHRLGGTYAPFQALSPGVQGVWLTWPPRP